MEKEEFKSLEKLKRYIDQCFKDFFGSVLDYTEVAVDSKDRQRALRSRVLKLGNDKIREINRELDDHYRVKYIATNEDIIQIINKKNDSGE